MLNTYNQELGNTYKSEVLAVELAGPCEEHGSGRHVQSHSKRFSRKQSLDQPFRKQDLYRLLQYRQQTCNCSKHLKN